MTVRSDDNPETVAVLLDRAATRAPDATALIYRDNNTSYAAMADRVTRLTGFLASVGIGPGDRVGFWLPSVPAYLLLYLACARRGAIAVAVNTRYRAAEAGDILARSRAKLVVLWPGFRQIDFAGILRDIDPALLGAVETVLVYGEPEDLADPVEAVAPALPGRQIVRYAEAAAHAPDTGDYSGPDAGCNIFTTSGTTSRPKLVLHRQYAIAAHADEVARQFGLTRPETVTLQALPFCGVFGFCQAMASLAAMRPMAMMAAFDAAEAVRLCQHDRVTQFNATDDMVDRMLRTAADSASFAAAPFASIDFVGYGAFNSAIEDLPERAAAQGIRLVGLWGMSEMQALVARRQTGGPIAERCKAGGPLVSPAARARVRDPETGALLPPGKAGMLEITGPSRMVEYLDDPEATAAALAEDGYVRTGDLAVLEEGGGFEFLARMGDALRLGGFLVSPAEIEAEVMGRPGITGALVVAVSAAGRNRAVAFVTLAPGVTFDEAAALARCAARLADYKRPARILPLDAFPVTDSANGIKIQRAKLREMAGVAVEREPS
jgi:fatty-acyl-CoA synthase